MDNEWKLEEITKKKYMDLIQSAQSLESTIGNLECRKQKFISAREGIDKELKLLWEGLIKEFNLDPNKDYQIDLQGIIRDVTKSSHVGQAKTIEDLK